MIHGTGDIASVLTDKPGYTYFACGVSNREPISQRQKEREMYQIWQAKNEGMFVYFSTLSVYYSDSEYTRHKIDMEKIVRARFKDYTIVRIGNIDWGTNPNTLINYLTDKIKKGEPYEVQDTYRYIVSKEEFQHWIEMIPEKGKHEMNITGKMMKVIEIVERIKKGI